MLNEDVRIYKSFGGLLLRGGSLLPREFYVIALKAADPLAEIEKAAARRREDPSYTFRKFKADIKGDWVASDGIYGEPISFRGLRHAPINEQGVVFLFGMLAMELGFHVEAVQSGFPDCEAKRCVDKQRNKWKKVRIEFESRSSEFVRHGHAIEGADVIVCWTHDWTNCPLEVVELRSKLKELSGDN